MGKRKEEDEEDRRREAAIASTLPLQPNFKPIGVTHQQLSKFQYFELKDFHDDSKKLYSRPAKEHTKPFLELHRKRLQIKAKSKIHKKLKDRTKKFNAEDLNTIDSHEEHSNSKFEDSSVPNLRSQSEDDNPFTWQDNAVMQSTTKKQQKLHWGLDTKERWERKANM